MSPTEPAPIAGAVPVGRPIILASAAICRDCQGWIRPGRVAVYAQGAVTCVACHKKRHGEAEYCDEEKRMMDELVAGNVNPDFELGIAPKPPRGSRRRGED